MLILTLLVRDEADIIAANLDYHFSAGVDFAIVTDHRSVDDTPTILERYRRGGRIQVIHEEAETYDQTSWVTKMARMAYELGASWVINSDADEFWWTAHGNLHLALSTVPDVYDILTVRRHDFPPVEDESGRFSDRMIYREMSSHNLLGDALPPKVCHRAHADITVAQGNHYVIAERLGETLDDGRVEILHFPMRTYEQFERKIVNGGSAYEAPGSPSGVGRTWRHAYGLWRAGRLRALYDERVLDRVRVANRLSRGEIVKDTRLKTALERLSPVPRVPRAAGGEKPARDVAST
ncbi:MAG: glycosyltransferase family 2 protein [Aeromicrobium sp.]